MLIICISHMKKLQLIQPVQDHTTKKWPNQVLNTRTHVPELSGLLQQTSASMLYLPFPKIMKNKPFLILKSAIIFLPQILPFLECHLLTSANSQMVLLLTRKLDKTHIYLNHSHTGIQKYWSFWFFGDLFIFIKIQIVGSITKLNQMEKPSFKWLEERYTHSYCFKIKSQNLYW